MANHKSAAKRARQTIKRTARTRPITSRVNSAIRNFREALAAGDKAKAEETLKIATRLVRKAASKGIMHTRTASRRVSRLASAFNSAQ